MSTTVTVTGMTCGCCANKVRTEVGKIAGVTEIDIDVDSGVVTAHGAADRSAVADAVVAAGYTVTA
ncbi:heavy-metal-associated domain-containing protein [Nocardia yamanashiensis]|uniref:heavy-metal-associated domain-containing protein n=1 Tax=Nocardia yamanashiensis TaxID=209247 RepID=UPI000831B8CB|nr:heavy-metal-associated domain-containing protein [Nocardia yamanashiensis]UGT42653.1 heavy-metal-associated domain-containing protein [Nocardia yamanashiensis]